MAKDISPVLRKKWATEATSDIVLNSVWEQLGNRSIPGTEIPKDGSKTIPKDVIHAVSASQTKEDYSVIIPLRVALSKDGVGGQMSASGTEEDLIYKTSKSFFNNVRKTINMKNNGVEFNSVSYLQKAKESYDALKEWMAVNRDYSKQMALTEGGDRYLIDNQYWQDNTDLTTAPVTRALHPNIAYRGMSAGFTRSATYATDVANLAAAMASMTVSSMFNKDALVKAINFARAFVTPLVGWKSGNNGISHVIMISEIQAQQLQNDSNWNDLWSSAGERGVTNRAISGVIGGPFMGCLVVVDPRAPIFRLDAGSIGFEYVTPMLGATFNSLTGLQNLTRIAKGAASVQTGTCEVCRILGAGAIGMPHPMDLTYTTEDRDYKFRTGLAAEEMIGHVRLDYTDSTGAGKRCPGSALYFTATPAFTY